MKRRGLNIIIIIIIFPSKSSNSLKNVCIFFWSPYRQIKRSENDELEIPVESASNVL